MIINNINSNQNFCANLSVNQNGCEGDRYKKAADNSAATVNEMNKFLEFIFSKEGIKILDSLPRTDTFELSTSVAYGGLKGDHLVSSLSYNEADGNKTIIPFNIDVFKQWYNEKISK